MIFTISFHGQKIPRATFFGLLALCVLIFTSSSARAELTARQARKLITRMAGFTLTNGSVRVKTVSAGAAVSEVSAEIRTVFKLENDQQGNWRVAEIRIGQDRWEEIDLIARALKTQLGANECSAPDAPFRGAAAVDPSVKRARCLLGSLLGLEVPSDLVRIQNVSTLAIPLASQPSAVVVAWVKAEVRFVNDDKTGWKVSELRSGNREWVKLAPLVTAVNDEKQKKARTELAAIAKGLEQFRRDHGFYVVSDKEAVVIDHLNPRYLTEVIRVDPWHQPYKYQGEHDHFILRSAGPDGKDDTADDIQLAGPSR
ncbi:MAG: type II secretion system protein GspG [Acidobacteriota bacterium]|nr:type II secretion system protein GspG [Acidobacteriota bacterium]